MLYSCNVKDRAISSSKIKIKHSTLLKLPLGYFLIACFFTLRANSMVYQPESIVQQVQIQDDDTALYNTLQAIYICCN